MPTPTYTPLANLTVSSSVATITLGSISQLYRDLILVIGGTAPAGDVYMKLNNSSSSFSWVSMRGDGSSINSTTGTGAIIGFGLTGQTITQIMDYSTDKHKTIFTRIDYASNGTNARTLRWANASAITSITLDSNTYPVGFTVALYGIAA